MRRSAFLALLGAGAACVSAWPAAAQAQRSDLPRVVVLSPGFTGTTRLRPVHDFLQRMAELGWRHGRNVDFAFQIVDNETTAVTEIESVLEKFSRRGEKSEESAAERAA